jgi:hypothetical protein
MATKQRRSVAWKYFEHFEEENVRCTECGTVLSYHNSTSSMLSHLSAIHGISSQSSADSSGTVQQKLDRYAYSTRCSKERASEITKRIARMVALDLRPISIVEGRGFGELLEYIEPGYSVPSHTHISTTCRHMYRSLMEKVKEEISICESVALTTDTWTSNVTDSYITVTAHFINKSWELCTRVLCPSEMPERHTGENIAIRLNQAVEHWNIQSVSAVVHDNAANANSGVSQTGWPHFGCVAHTLQLCINSGLGVSVISRLSAASRKLVGHFKHSSVAKAGLKAKQELLGIQPHSLIQDISTRWNSTYFMYERLAEQQIAIYAVLHDTAITRPDHRQLDLKQDQWELLSQMVVVLKPLQVATTVISNEKNVCCSIIYPIVQGLLLNHLIVKDDDLVAVRRFKEIVCDELNKRFDPSSLATSEKLPVISAAVDPRYSKLRFLSEEQKESTYRRLITMMAQIDTLEVEDDSYEMIESSIQEEPPTKKINNGMQFLLGDSLLDNIPSSSIESELDYFKREPTLDPDSDPLCWWKRNEDRFSTLSKVAKQLLCIPASSVPSERVFSTAGNIVTKKRASLTPSNVDMLIFLNKNL